MDRLYKSLLLTSLLVYQAFLSAATWQQTPEPGFNIEINISKDRLALNETVNFELLLHYPENYSLNPEIVRYHLIPFNHDTFEILNEQITHAQENQQKITRINYELAPRRSGDFFLSFLNIPFEPQKEFFTPFFKISVDSFNPAQIPLPDSQGLLPLSGTLPIKISYENRKNLIDNPLLQEREEQRNRQIVYERTFPWSPILLFLGLLILLPLIIYRLKEARN